MSSTYTTEAVAALARWGTDSEMRPAEAVMWRAEAELQLRSTVLSIEILDTVPDWDRLVAAHEWGVAAIPRARQRVLEPPLGLGHPTWVEDEHFDLSYHLRRTSLPGDGSMRELLDLARTIAESPFDRHRPPWEMTLVEGLPDGRAAYVSKMHHSTTDGLGGMQLVALGRSRTREHTPDKPVARGEPPRPRTPSTAEVVRDHALHRVREVPARIARTAAGARSLAGRLVRDPAGPALEAIRYADSLRRIVGAAPAPGSPLLANRSASWHFEVHDVPLVAMKAVSSAVDASINDVYIAALLGAFRLYHRRMGSAVDVMPIAFPISLRRGDDPLGGNRFAGARLAGPVGVADPRERIGLVRQAVLEVRAEPAVAALDRLAGALVNAPTPVLTRVLLALGQDNDVQASNVPGVPFTTYLAGARVERMYPFGPLPGCAAMITMLSHDGTCCIGVNLDPAAITEPDVFRECLVDGFDEVLALGG